MSTLLNFSCIHVPLCYRKIVIDCISRVRGRELRLKQQWYLWQKKYNQCCQNNASYISYSWLSQTKLLTECTFIQWPEFLSIKSINIAKKFNFKEIFVSFCFTTQCEPVFVNTTQYIYVVTHQYFWVSIGEFGKVVWRQGCLKLRKITVCVGWDVNLKNVFIDHDLNYGYFLKSEPFLNIGFRLLKISFPRSFRCHYSHILHFNFFLSFLFRFLFICSFLRFVLKCAFLFIYFDWYNVFAYDWLRPWILSVQNLILNTLLYNTAYCSENVPNFW